MISVMLVAGDRTKDLTSYFRQRESLEVVYSYSSIANHKTIIQNSIIKVDKLVYVYQDDSINIRRDMETLKELLKNNGFFTVKEIVFFIKVTKETEKGLDYFKAVMEDCKFENYSIEKSRNSLTFVQLYDNLLGISQNANVRNSYQKVYRVERDSDTKEVYEPGTDINLIEPFNYKKVENYEKAKQTTVRTESGTIIEDEGTESNIRVQFDEPNLSSIQTEGIFENKNIFIVTGNPKAGKTTNTIALAVSAMEASKRVTIITIEDYKDLQNYLKYFKIKFTEFNARNLILKRRIESEDKLSIVDITSKEDDTRLSCIKYCMENIYKFDTDIFIIELPNRLLKDTLTLTGFKTNRVFYISDFIKKEVEKASKILMKDAEKFKRIVMLSDVINRAGCCKLITGVEAKEILGKDTAVIQPIRFDDFKISDNLYNSVMGVIE